MGSVSHILPVLTKSWILLVSSNIWLQLSNIVLPIFLPFDLELKLPFSQSSIRWSWMTWYKLKKKNYNRPYVYGPTSRLLFYHSESSLGHLMPSSEAFKQQIKKSHQIVTAILTLPSRDSLSSSLKILTGCPLDSETEL